MPITNLVFQGGSVKGLAYIGALEHVDLKQVKRVAGTSAGSIMAGLLAVGCTLEGMYSILAELDFKKLLDDQQNGFNVHKKLLKTVDKAQEGSSVIVAVKPIKTVKYPVISRISKQSGVFEGEYFRQWIENIIRCQVSTLTNNQVSGEYLTFAELHQLTLDYPEAGFRDLKVIGANLDEKTKKIFCYEDADFRDVIISDAMRISMSIPVIFKPHQLHFKVDGQRVPSPDAAFWVDGGIYDNYPINCFDAPQYMPAGVAMAQAVNGTQYNQHTLGFRLVTAEDKRYYEGNGNRPQGTTRGLFGMLGAMGMSGLAVQEEKNARPENLQRTIHIDHLGISILQFDLSEDHKKGLINSGKQAAQMYFNPQDIIAAAAP